MDIQHVREFITVAQSRNLPSTADQYYISSSLLSLHIRKIEDELGYPLFTRTSRTLVLNEQGRTFLPYAKKVVAAYDDYKEHAEKVQEQHNHELCIGLIGSVSQPTAEHLIADFYKQNSDIRLYVKSRDESSLLIDFLREGACDFLFLHEADAPSEDIIADALFTDSIVAVVPPTHRLAGRSYVGIKDIQSENILMQNAENKVFQKILNYAENQGIRLNVSFAINAHSLMEDMLEIGAGIGLMTNSGAMSMERSNLVYLPLKPALSIDFSLLYVKKRSYTSAEKRFLHYIRSKFQNHNPL